ncbi:MAG: glycosyltransferase [Candidatus Falkowbacteria bacterium]
MISIILPTYNRANILPNAIKSVIAQTYSDWELIIVDDGSTDNTREIVNGFLTDSRISFVNQENFGPIVARNNGVKMAKGNWLAFLDSDDIWLSEKLSKQITLAQTFAYPVMIIGNYVYIDELGQKQGEFFSQKTTPHSGRVLAQLLRDNFILTSSVLVLKKYFEKVGGFDEQLNLTIGEDYELWLRLAGELEIYYVNEPVALYRIHAVQLTKQKLRVYHSILKLYWHLFWHNKKYHQLSKMMILSGFCSRIKRILQASST